MPRAESHLPPLPASVGQARAFVSARLAEWGLEAVTWDVLQVVSEMATNAVLHARTPFTVRLEHAGTLRLEVQDASLARPHERHYDPSATTGRGLALLALLGDSWGSQPTADGKVVWWELQVAAHGHRDRRLGAVEDLTAPPQAAAPEPGPPDQTRLAA